MTNNVQAKQHKVIHKLDERLSTIEGIILLMAHIASIVLIIIGFSGFTIALTMDKIRGRLPEFDWLQITGMCLFFIVFIIGGALATILKKVSNGVDV